MKNSRRIARFLARGSLLALAYLAVGEITLRVYDHFYPLFVFFDDSYNRFRGNPAMKGRDFNLNSLGFNDEEFSEKDDDTYRILGIGDSFAFGVVPYPDNYLTLIESSLRGEGLSIEVLNMGIPRIGPKEYLSLFMQEGLELEPDMVLLSFFVGNDFTDLRGDLPGKRKRKLYEYSHLTSLVHYLLNVRPRYEADSGRRAKRYCDDCPTFTRYEYLKIQAARSLIYVERHPLFSALLERAVHYIEKMNELCDRRGIDLMVVIIPDEMQIDPDLARQVRETYFPNVVPLQWNATRPNEALSAELERLGIRHLDLWSSFAGVSHPPLYRPRDTHWNIAGNRLAAEVIQRGIQEHLARKPVPGT
jgi:hypothetical protein